MSSSSDMLGTGSRSSSSSSGSMDNFGSGTSPTFENGHLSIFTFVSNNAARFSSSRTTLNDLSMDSAYSPSPDPTFCTCFHGEKSPSGTMKNDLTRILDDPESSCHWKYHHQQLFGEDEMNRKCACHVHPHSRHNSQTNLRILSRAGDGIILRSLEKGVLFPLVHWSTKNDNRAHPLHLHFSPKLQFNQGIYKEWKRVIPPDIWLHHESDPYDSSSSSPVQPRKPTTWILIGYKSLDKTLDFSLEATWKEWTGTRHVYLRLRSDFEIRRISFFHRVHPTDNLDLFMYVVLIEIGNVDDRNRIWLLDFVQRMRVERMKGFLTVYSTVEPNVTSITDEYERYKDNAEITCNFHQSTHQSESPFRMTHSSNAASPSFVHERDTSALSQNLLEAQTQEINGNIKFMEELVEEIRQQPIGDYF